MRLGCLALAACAAVAGCAPAGYYDTYGGSYSYVAPAAGYSYAAPAYGYAAPYGYVAPAPAVVGIWGGGRGYERERFERERFARERFGREREFRGGGRPEASRAWAGGGRPPEAERRGPSREGPRNPRGWP